MSKKGRKTSFGGVAALFGDDDDDNNSYATVPKNTASRAAKASYGGVGAIFSQPEEPQTQQRRAQPSFGGVAAMFGDDDDSNFQPATQVRPAGRQASFGGVAALFGTDDNDEVGAVPVNNTPSQPPSNKKNQTRKASFGGVATLFADQEEDTAPPPVPASSAAGTGNITNLFSSGPSKTSRPAAQNKSPSEGLGSLPQMKNKKKSGGKRGKRDPSISGIAAIFETDDDSDEAQKQTAKAQAKDRTETIHKDLEDQIEKFRNKADKLNIQCERESDRNEDLKQKIKQLKEQQETLIASKMELVASTAREMERMRDVMKSMCTPPQSAEESTERAATVG